MPELGREELKGEDSEYFPKQNEEYESSDVEILNSSVRTGRSATSLSSSLKILIDRAS